MYYPFKNQKLLFTAGPLNTHICQKISKASKPSSMNHWLQGEKILLIFVGIKFSKISMANKIPWYATVNWKSILETTIILGIIVGLAIILLLPKIIRHNKLENYRGETTAKVLSVKENITTRQGSDGNKVVVDHYDVKFRYKVNGKPYEGTNALDGTPKNTYYLNKVAKSNYEMPVSVRYDMENPAKALIIFEE